MTPKVTIFTPTYNKPELFAQCAESVLSQTYQDWVWWVVFNSTNWNALYTFEPYAVDWWNDPRVVPIWYPATDNQREFHHVTAQIINWVYSKIQTPYLYVLADDDLIDPDGLAELVRVIDYWSTNETWSEAQAVYGRVSVQNEQDDGTFKDVGWVFDGKDVGLGTDVPNPDCILDSSSILHTKALWLKAISDGWRLTDKLEDAAHVDGILLARLAQFAKFHYVPQRINIHRRTNLSTWHKPQGA